MALPNAPLSATQLAQQKAQEPKASPVEKQGPSKFDQTMSNKTPPAGSAQGVPGAAEAQRANGVSQVDQAAKAEKAQNYKVGVPTDSSARATARAADPVGAQQETSRATFMMSNMVSEMEKGQGLLDKLINGGLHGAKFNNTELLALQAGMYKYTQELDLTGKVVDKATQALKDTLKTQV